MWMDPPLITDSHCVWATLPSSCFDRNDRQITIKKNTEISECQIFGECDTACAHCSVVGPTHSDYVSQVVCRPFSLIHFSKGKRTVERAKGKNATLLSLTLGKAGSATQRKTLNLQQDLQLLLQEAITLKRYTCKYTVIHQG